MSLAKNKVMSTSQKIWAVVLLASFSMLGDTSAHHVPGHDQNPNPPAPLGPTPVTHFDAGSLIIPMDGCYQRPSFMSTKDLERVGRDPAADKCNGSSDKDDGIIPAYSLLARLILNGVPVSWSIRAGKTSFHDSDFTITRAGGHPVEHVNILGTVTKPYGGLVQISYTGAPFVIAAADAPQAMTLLKGFGGISGTYKDVDLHVAMVGFDAPIFSTVTSLPKLAIVDVREPALAVENEKTAFLLSSVQDAVMGDLEGILWELVSVQDVLDGRLVSGDFVLAWVPPYELTEGSPPTPRQAALLTKFVEFADQGGNLLFQDSSISSLEGWGDWSSGYVEKVPSTAPFQIDGGLIANGISSSWDNGDDDERTIGQDFSDPAAQFGGINWTGIGGSKHNWKPRYDRAYLEGVRRMVYTDHDGDNSKDDWDLATWRHMDNDPNKGVIYYLGGYNWRRVTASGFRLLMNTMYVHSNSTGPSVDVQISRSSPIVAAVGGTLSQIQGTFEATLPAGPPRTYSGTGDDILFQFPAAVGHMRAVDVSLLTSTGTLLADIPPVFDAAVGIPPAVDGGCGVWFSTACRTVFTNTATGAKPALVFMTTSNAPALKPFMGPTLSNAESQTLVSRVLAGYRSAGSWEPKLGGVDRSTVALIGASPVVGNVRPTIAYFGALDGMLHAVCAEVLGPCQALGQELWAFVPRTELWALRMNAARVDGSPTVSDVFADFAGSGVKEWRTVLTFQTASGDSQDASKLPAAYALDITHPDNPTILWEKAPPSTRGSLEQGVGINLSMGTVVTGQGRKNVTFIATNNGGTGGPGIVVSAVETATGDPVWTFGKLYPSARLGSNPPVPATAIPGGIAGVDTVGGRTFNRIVVPDLYGSVWLLDAVDGTSVYGNTALFRFTSDFHPIGAPPSVYAENGSGRHHVVIASGGYADPLSTSWSPDNVTQYAVSVALDAPQNVVPVSENGLYGTARAFLVDLGVGNRVFSQATIAGNELFVVTDSQDVNSLSSYLDSTPTGQLTRVSLSDGSNLGSFALGTGAGGVDVSQGTVYSGDGTTAQRTQPTGFDANGTTTERVFDAKKGRRLWLMLQ